MRKKYSRNASLTEPLTRDASKITSLEEKLRRICGIICGMQHETVLQKMVIFL